MPKREYDFFVYILASRSRQLYVGFTNGLAVRVKQHKEHRPGSYTARYNIDRLVYSEHFQYVMHAINREKELKAWNRAKKIALIESIHPTWEDLSLRFGNLAAARADPSATLRDGKGVGDSGNKDVDSNQEETRRTGVRINNKAPTIRLYYSAARGRNLLCVAARKLG
jgi:putative endonuclease